MKKKLFLLLVFMLLIVMLNTNMASGMASGSSLDQQERQMQSASEFVVALDPEFADQWLSGQKELFVVKDKEAGSTDNQGSEEKSKKLPPGLLKKALDGKEVHIRNLERYAANHSLELPLLITVEVKDENMLQEARAAVELCEGVLYTDPLAYYYSDGFNDPRVPEQWGIIPIDAYDAWKGNMRLSGITIAIIDTGVRLTHEDLGASIVKGWDFIGNDPDPTDENGHGTHVAGIAAAISDNWVGIASPAGGAKIMPIRVLDANGRGTVLEVSDGIRYAADNGADIINLSLGGTGETVTMRMAVEYAQSKGCLVVASAGNNNSTLPNYPAAHNGVIIAASLSVSPEPQHPYAESHFSNYNADLAYRTIHAPGEKILSTYYSSDSSYVYLSGTSMSAPFVSGIAAALKARGDLDGSLYDAVIDASVSMPRAMLDSSGGFWKVSGEMMVLNDNGHLALPNYSGRLVLTTPGSASSRIVQVRVEARNSMGVRATDFNGTVDVSFVRSTGFYIPMFGSPQYTTFVQQVELISGVGIAYLDLAGYNHNGVVYLWATDPSGQFSRSADVRMPLYNAADFRGYNVNVTVEKPDTYIGPSSLPTGSEKFELQVYIAYYESIDSNEPPPGMSSAGASEGRLKWNPVKLQYEGTLNLPRGKVQLYYYVYYNGYDKRYPNPQPIGQPIILMSDTSITGKLLPYEHNVTFAANGGEPAPASQPLPAGGLVTPPGTINREGHDFQGWYSNPSFAGAPYDFRAPVYSSITLYAKWAQNAPNCRIGQIVYNTLSDALAAAKSGSTITLLSDIQYRKTLEIIDKKIAFDLSGHTLDVVYIANSVYGSSSGMLVINGEVKITGGGELNVKSTDMSGFGLRAINSIVEITNAFGGEIGVGVRAESNSKVTLRGNARGLSGVDSISGSLVTVYGDAIGINTGPQNRSSGIHTNNAEIIVYGDVLAQDAVCVNDGKATVYGNVFGEDSYYSSGIKVVRSGSVAVYGNVTTGMEGVYCSTNSDTIATVIINGNLTCTFPAAIGVEMGYFGNETVTVNGTISAPTFAKLFGTVKNASDFTVPTTKAGYKTYSGVRGTATVTLWHKDPNAVLHTVTFAANGGTPAPANQFILSGAAAIQPTAMTKAGYSFSGWYASSAFTGSPYDFGKPVTSNLMLYAKWVENKIFDTASFIPNGGVPAPAAQTVAQGSLATAPAVMTKSGSIFNGWYTSASFSGQPYDFKTPINANIILYAKWASAVTVAFDPAGGSNCAPILVEANTPYGTLPTPVRSGYTFDGWYLKSNLTSKVTETASAGKQNHTLFAGWKVLVSSCTVSFTANGGAPTPAAQTVKPGSLATAPAAMTKSGAIFKGWFTSSNFSGQPYNFGTPVNTNTVLYAKWATAITVTFDSAGGSSCASKLIEASAPYGSLPAPVRSGYVFDGWYTKANLKDKVTETTIADKKNHTLYASWKPAK
jgi:thermitase